MTDAAGTLERAADLLETVGWVQNVSVQYGYGHNPERLGIDGPIQVVGYCASGALVKAASTSQEYEVAMAILARGMKSSVIRWNDAPGRTKFEVVDAMRHAAKDLRNEAVPE